MTRGRKSQIRHLQRRINRLECRLQKLENLSHGDAPTPPKSTKVNVSETPISDILSSTTQNQIVVQPKLRIKRSWENIPNVIFRNIINRLTSDPNANWFELTRICKNWKKKFYCECRSLDMSGYMNGKLPPSCVAGILYKERAQGTFDWINRSPFANLQKLIFNNVKAHGCVALITRPSSTLRGLVIQDCDFFPLCDIPLWSHNRYPNLNSLYMKGCKAASIGLPQTPLLKVLDIRNVRFPLGLTKHFYFYVKESPHLRKLYITEDGNGFDSIPWMLSQFKHLIRFNMEIKSWRAYIPHMSERLKDFLIIIAKISSEIHIKVKISRDIVSTEEYRYIPISTPEIGQVISTYENVKILVLENF